MAEGDVRVPAGWYPDPLGLPQLRWWDNHAWTEYTSDARQPMVAQETVTQQARLAYADDEFRATGAESTLADAASATATATASDGAGADAAMAKPTAEALLSLEAPVREELVEEELSPADKFAEFVPDNAPTTAAFNLDTRFDDLLGDPIDEPLVAPSAAPAAFAHVGPTTTPLVTAPVVPEPAVAPVAPVATASAATEAATVSRSTSTPFAWIIALSPVYSLITAMFALLSGTAEQQPVLVPIVVFLVPWLGVILMAFLDNRRMLKRGLTPPHWGLAVLTAPVYLIVRTVLTTRQTGHGFGTLGTWFGMIALTIAAVLTIPGLVISLAPQAFAMQASSSLEQQASALGANISVECSPMNVPTIVGQSFICLATRKDGATWGVNVSLVHSNGWIDWQVTDWGPFRLTSNGKI